MYQSNVIPTHLQLFLTGKDNTTVQQFLQTSVLVKRHLIPQPIINSGTCFSNIKYQLLIHEAEGHTFSSKDFET